MKRPSWILTQDIFQLSVFRFIFLNMIYESIRPWYIANIKSDNSVPMQTVATCKEIHNNPDCWAIGLCLWEGWANGQLRNSSQKVAKPQLNLPIKKVNCSLKTISTINYYFTRSFWTHRVLNTVPFQHSGYVFFCLCNLVYEHLFTLTVELFLLRNTGGVCRHLVGHNQGDGSWSNKAARHCLCYTPAAVSWSLVLSSTLTHYPNIAEQMPIHHQPIR